MGTLTDESRLAAAGSPSPEASPSVGPPSLGPTSTQVQSASPTTNPDGSDNQPDELQMTDDRQMTYLLEEKHRPHTETWLFVGSRSDEQSWGSQCIQIGLHSLQGVRRWCKL